MSTRNPKKGDIIFINVSNKRGKERYLKRKYLIDKIGEKILGTAAKANQPTEKLERIGKILGIIYEKPNNG